MATHQCSTAQEIDTYTFYLCSLCVFITISYGFIKYMQNVNSDSPSILKTSLVSFYIFALLTVILMSLNSYNLGCLLHLSPATIETYRWYQIFFILFVFSYICHWYSLINILFLRLKLVFNTNLPIYSQLKLSKCTLITFGIMSVILVIDVLLTIMSNPYIPINREFSQLFPVFFMFYGFLDLVISLYVTLLFLHKLWRLNQLVSASNVIDSDTDSVIPMITKCSVLTTISTVSTILALLSEGLNWCFLLDIFTNFVCITLTLSFAKPVYYRYCSCIDSRCQRCMNHCAAAKSIHDTKFTAKELNCTPDASVSV